MHSTRRLMTGAVTAVGLLALAACGGGGDAEEPAGGADGGSSGGALSGELSISALNSDKAALEAAIDAFSAANPDVEITTTWADPDQYQPTLRTQLTGGTAADLIQIWPGAGNSAAISFLAPAGHLEDLSDREWASQIPEGLRPVLTQDDTVYGLAVTVSGVGAVFNDQALEEVGGSVPTTWDEVLGLCAAAQEAGKVAFALGNQDAWVAQLISYAIAPELVYADNPDLDMVDEYTAPHFAGSDWEQVLDQYMEMDAAGCFQEGPNGTDYNTTLEMVGQGEALAIINGNWAIQGLTENAADGATFSLHPVPGTDDTEAVQMAAAASGTYGVNANAQNKDAALAFIDFLASAEGTNAFAEVNAGLPGIPNDEFELDPSLQALGEYFNEGRTYPFMDQLWPNPDVQNAHMTGVQGLFDGSMTIEDVLKSMDEAWSAGPA